MAEVQTSEVEEKSAPVSFGLPLGKPRRIQDVIKINLIEICFEDGS
jgi:hypothetical protein